jgi:VanZ family protein
MYVLLIFFMSSRPYLQSPGPDFRYKDKLAHVVEYFVLGSLLALNMRWFTGRSKALTFLFLFAVGASVAALDEVFQSYVPGRSIDVFDWVADTLGVAAGVGLCGPRGIRMKTRKPASADPEAFDSEGNDN